jgi:hypothetical protein
MMGTRLFPVLVIVRCIFAQDHIDYAQYVNPFIGTEGAIPGLACKTHNSLYALFSDKFQMAAAMYSLAEQYHLVWSNWGLIPMKKWST